MKRILLLLTLFTGTIQAADPLVIYNGRSDHFVRPVVERFTATTGIPVVLHAGSATELLTKLTVEGERTPADLYLSNDAGTLQIGEDRALFARLPDVLTARVPTNYRGQGGTWVGLSARARVIVVNESVASPPTSIFDLADPRWRGRLGVTVASNESFVAGLSVYQALVGDARAEAWLRGLRANAGDEVYTKHGAIVDDVAAGRRDVGLVNHYYVFRHLAENPDAPIRLVMPDQDATAIGAAWNVAGIAVSRHSRRRAEAEAFVEFVLSGEGQRLFADANNEYPTATGVEASAALPPVATLRVADLPLGELAPRRAAALDLIDKVGMP